MTDKIQRFIAFGRGEISLALWLAKQTRRYLRVLEECGIQKEELRETEIFREHQNTRRMGLVHHLPTDVEGDRYLLAWDISDVFSDGVEIHAQLCIACGLTESDLMRDGRYIQPSTAGARGLHPMIELSFWPGGGGRPDHLIAYWYGCDPPADDLGKILWSFLPKGRPNGYYLASPSENGVIFSPAVGWKLAEALIRCLVERSRTSVHPPADKPSPDSP